MLANSVSDFWSRRWNLAFRDVAQVFFFRPFVARVGVGGATMIVFAMSGLIHDLVISLPSGGGYGLPSLYFLAQGIAVLVEKSRFGRRIGLGRGLTGRISAWLLVVSGAYWLFHPPFIRAAILPTLSALHAF
jgi:alginate O-acetyltransferase complex protein AlgI